MITGKAKAPWEDSKTSPEILNALGSLKNVVMGLLHRDPRQRMTLAKSYVACNRVLVQSTKTTKDNTSVTATFNDEYVSKVAEKIGEKIKEET